MKLARDDMPARKHANDFKPAQPGDISKLSGTSRSAVDPARIDAALDCDMAALLEGV
jgi:hypothetical protein